MKQPTTKTLTTEREKLEKERAERAQQRATIAAELEAAKQQSASSTERREAIRLAALAEGDEAAKAELEAVTREATTAALRKEDLAAVLGDLDAKITKLDVKLSRLQHRAELAALRTMHQGEHRALAEVVDTKAAELVDAVAQFNAFTLTMSRRALAAGISNGGRINNFPGVLGSILARIAPDAPVTRQAHPHHRKPLAEQVDAWAHVFDEREAVDSGSPSRATVGAEPAPAAA